MGDIWEIHLRSMGDPLVDIWEIHCRYIGDILEIHLGSMGCGLCALGVGL